jgi:hypothetical protein
MKKKITKESHLYTPAELRTIANASGVDPKTVARWLDGAPVRPTGRARMMLAFAEFQRDRALEVVR